MSLRHLHAYPKVFNSQGNLKAFPFRRPLRVNFWNAFWVSSALFFLFHAHYEWTFYKYARADFFKRDKTELLLRKRSFDTLILANKHQKNADVVRDRSIF